MLIVLGSSEVITLYTAYAENTSQKASLIFVPMLNKYPHLLSLTVITFLP